MEHPGGDRGSFTGGRETAQKVQRSAATPMTPAFFELGGKSPVVVFDSADLDGAEALLKKRKARFTRFDSLPPFLSGNASDGAAQQPRALEALLIKTNSLVEHERELEQRRAGRQMLRC